MKAWELLGATSAPDGTDIRLTRRGREYVILANGRPLMSSRLHGSEEALATLGCIVGSIVAGVAFVAVEKRVPVPLLDLALLRNRV